MGLRPAPVPVFAVPDEETWLAWGEDLRARGWAAVMDPERAELLVGPDALPRALRAAAGDAWTRMPARRELRTLASPLGGDRLGEVLRHAGELPPPPEDGGHEHDHGDMMAITGEPSADRLVMEPLELEVGPLGVALPTGLVVSAALDGDVVADCAVRGTLGAPPPRGDAALAHLAWLHRFARLLGWRQLAERARVVARAALDGRRAEAAGAADRLGTWLEGSAALRRRTQGLATVDGTDARSRTLRRVDAARRALRDGDGDPAEDVPLAAAGAAAVDLHGDPVEDIPPAAAGAAALGLEWSAALVAIASLDPSPWAVPS